jgi:hypothetical protein
MMTEDIEAHYVGPGELATRIKDSLVAAGKNADRLTTADLAAVDEFHIRGR